MVDESVTEVDIGEVSANLPALLSRVEQGERILINRNGSRSPRCLRQPRRDFLVSRDDCGAGSPWLTTPTSFPPSRRIVNPACGVVRSSFTTTLMGLSSRRRK